MSAVWLAQLIVLTHTPLILSDAKIDWMLAMSEVLAI